MKKTALIYLLFMIVVNCNAQYFRDAKYFNRTFAEYNYDSMVLLSINDSVEEYRVFRKHPLNKRILNTFSIKKIRQDFFFRLDNNQDSDYHLFFKLGSKVNDTFFLHYYDESAYFTGQKSNLKIDSLVAKVVRISMDNFHGKIKRQLVIYAGQANLGFIDSIGLSTDVFFQSTLHYVCYNGAIGFTIYTDKNNSCNTDTFFKYFKIGVKDVKLNTKNRIIYSQESQKIKIDCESFDLLRVLIYNTLGQNIYFQPIQENSTPISIDVSFLDNGFYFVSLLNAYTGQRQVFKFLINN